MEDTKLESFPFDSINVNFDDWGDPIYDRAVGASMYRQTLKQFFSNGVFASPGTEMELSKGSGLRVNIAEGIAIIEGALMAVPEGGISVKLTDEASTVGTKAYGVFLKFDDNTDKRSCYVSVRAGEAGPSPVPPEPDRTSPGIWELRLGYVTVPSGATDLSGATVTNEKGLQYCPYAAPFMEIDVSGITADFRAQADEALDFLLDYFNEYKEMVDAAVDETLAGQLQQQINDIKSQLENIDLSGAVDNETIEYSQRPGQAKPDLHLKDAGVTASKIGDIEDKKTIAKNENGLLYVKQLESGVLAIENGGTGFSTQEALLDFLSDKILGISAVKKNESATGYESAGVATDDEDKLAYRLASTNTQWVLEDDMTLVYFTSGYTSTSNHAFRIVTKDGALTTKTPTIQPQKFTPNYATSFIKKVGTSYVAMTISGSGTTTDSTYYGAMSTMTKDYAVTAQQKTFALPGGEKSTYSAYTDAVHYDGGKTAMVIGAQTNDTSSRVTYRMNMTTDGALSFMKTNTYIPTYNYNSSYQSKAAVNQGTLEVRQDGQRYTVPLTGTATVSQDAINNAFSATTMPQSTYINEEKTLIAQITDTALKVVDIKGESVFERPLYYIGEKPNSGRVPYAVDGNESINYYPVASKEGMNDVGVVFAYNGGATSKTQMLNSNATKANIVDGGKRIAFVTQENRSGSYDYRIFSVVSIER